MSDRSERPRGLLGRLFGREKPSSADAVEPIEAPAETEALEQSGDTVAADQPNETDASLAETGEVAEPVAAVAEPTALHPDDARQTEAAEIEALDPLADVAAEPDSDAATLEPAAEPAPRLGWFQRLKSGLNRTSSKLGGGIADLFTKRKLDEATLDDLEDLLIQADLGMPMAQRIRAAVGAGRHDRDISPDEVRAVLAREVEAVLAPVARPLPTSIARPHVILVVGVNGTGKTTTIGKLAHRYRQDGKTVMLAAGDTFRAAAIDQLKIWAERTNSPILARAPGADSSGLAFDAVKSALEQDIDILLIDTAGRLQNKTALMQELEKVIRVMKKVDPDAPHDVLLVLDATTGQNALRQVDVFKDKAGVTGIVMTKLDGTARGGILVAIAEAYGLPVHAIGIGEQLDDLQPFDAGEFARAIAGA